MPLSYLFFHSSHLEWWFLIYKQYVSDVSFFSGTDLSLVMGENDWLINWFIDIVEWRNHSILFDLIKCGTDTQFYIFEITHWNKRCMYYYFLMFLIAKCCQTAATFYEIQNAVLITFNIIRCHFTTYQILISLPTYMIDNNHITFYAYFSEAISLLTMSSPLTR